MSIGREQLDQAVARGTITREQADALLSEAAARHPHPPLAGLYGLFRFPAVAVLSSVCALVALQAAAPFLLGGHPTGAQRSLLMTLLGVVLLAAGVLLDGWAGRSFIAWLYPSALVIFRVGLAGIGGDDVWVHALSLWVDLTLLVAAPLLRRPVFALAGTLGAAASIGALGEAMGIDGVAFGIVAGLAAAGLGASYLRYRETLEDEVSRRLPEWIRRRLAGERGL